MKNTTYTFDKSNDFTPTWEQVPGLSTDAIDYGLVKNTPKGSVGYAVLDFWATAGATGDGTYREVNIGGTNGDMQTVYTSFTLLVGLGTMDYKLTKIIRGVGVNGNNFIVPGGRTCRISCYPNGATYLPRVVVTGGSLRYLQSGNLDFTAANPVCTFVNASAENASFVIKFATSASNRPIFGMFIEIF